MSAGLVAALAPSTTIGSSRTDPLARQSASGALANAAPVATAYRTDPKLGVQWHAMWAHYSDAQRETILGRMVQSNIHLVRIDVSWIMLQPTNGTTFDPWGVAFVDRIINMINARGISTVVMLWLTPGWANDNKGDRVPPNNPADYARVAQWAANRYAGKVATWEVWNEPNSDDFFAGANPVTYTRLLQAAYPAFKVGDPKSQVMFGGTQYNDDAWIAKCYDAGVKGSFDIMSTHGYQGPSNQTPLTPDDGAIWNYTHIVAVRNLMVARGDGAKPISTGLGYSTHVDPPDTPNWHRGVSEVTQGIFLDQAVNLARQQWPWVKEWIWYSTFDDEIIGDDFNERHYGLLRADLSTKPALTALYDLTLPVSPA